MPRFSLNRGSRDIDVYLSPLVEDLKMLWEDGVETFDAFTSKTFMMRAMLFCTINDFPAYGNLSGYSVIFFYCMRHWQLVVISMKDNIVVWLCSLHRPPPNHLRQVIDW